MPSRCVPGEVFQAHPIKANYISQLSWECLINPPEELEVFLEGCLERRKSGPLCLGFNPSDPNLEKQKVMDDWMDGGINNSCSCKAYVSPPSKFNYQSSRGAFTS